MALLEHLKNGDWLRKFLLQGNMFFDMDVLNTKSKNLVHAFPLKQNLKKLRSWLGAPELIMAALTRGGVEDTRLEAKERNARDQGHNAQVISKKEGLRSKIKK